MLKMWTEISLEKKIQIYIDAIEGSKLKSSEISPKLELKYGSKQVRKRFQNGQSKSYFRTS